MASEKIIESALENLPKVLATSFVSLMLFKKVANDLIPDELQSYFFSSLLKLYNNLSSQATITIKQSDGIDLNEVFEAVTIYLGTKVSPSGKRTVFKSHRAEKLSFKADSDQEIVDIYEGIKFTWVLQLSPVKIKIGANHEADVHFYELSFLEKHQDMAENVYIPYILKKSKEEIEASKRLMIHTMDYTSASLWSSIPFDHPTTFKTMAMDADLKNELIDDLDDFLKSGQFYKDFGICRKRGYLLYGPPGTGKTSLIAAIANHLKFDVYDLKLRVVSDDLILQKILIGSKSRSIIVIEDIDCSVESVNRESGRTRAVEKDMISLSGLLNFIDGLWSICADEKIIIFTTNHKERIDPALLRRGRMDMEIEMPYCTFGAFKILASNSLNIEEHSSFRVIEELFSEARVNLTTSEVAGELRRRRSRRDPDMAFQKIIELFEKKKKQMLEHS